MTETPIPRNRQDGLLLVDKPQGWTSHDVVNLIRRRFRLDKVGHAGTLDPIATGLLVLLVGKATKLSDRIMADDKVYATTVTFGTATDSYDAEGAVTVSGDASQLDPETVSRALLAFQGDQMQMPPMVSAIKIDGKKLYELARQGKTIERPARPVKMHAITIEAMRLPHLDFTLHCSKGTYVRSLCHDLGEKLGCPAHMSALRRISCGPYSVDRAVTVEALKSMELPELARLLVEPVPG